MSLSNLPKRTEGVKSSTRAPSINIPRAFHKPSKSGCLESSPLTSVPRTSIGSTFSQQASRFKPPTFKYTNPKNVSILHSPNHSVEHFFMKEAIKTEKATTKKFDLSPQLANPELHMAVKARWEDLRLPLTPAQAIERFADAIPEWEQEEIRGYGEVYYIGKNFKPQEPKFDDENGDYKVLIKDHIAFRYEIIALIGKGSFGQVLEVYDHKEKRSIAIKVIKNKTKFNQQAKIEIEILETIQEFDTQHTSNIIELMGKFIFRKHIVRDS
jgi:hypothetical protein